MVGVAFCFKEAGSGLDSAVGSQLGSCLYHWRLGSAWTVNSSQCLWSKSALFQQTLKMRDWVFWVLTTLGNVANP